MLVCMVQEWPHRATCRRVSLHGSLHEVRKARLKPSTDSLCNSETRAWDVRTKKVTYEIIPTIEGVIGIANFGPTATLFTLGRNHTVQQYDINPTAVPLQVHSVQHVPANTPPTPPTNIGDGKNAYSDVEAGAPILPTVTTTDAESSADEGAMSPLQKIAKEMDSLDQMESELRDKVTPLSPNSSRASSVSSKSSGNSRRVRKYLYDRPSPSRVSQSTGFGTEFSFGPPASRYGHESISIRSTSSAAPSPAFRSSSLRKEILRSPEEAKDMAAMDLFPFTKARLRDVPFRTPHYGNVARTGEILRREMLSVVFGWNDDIENLIHDELSRHRPGSASSVLLAKWVGNIGADDMASMVGSESMTSSDWMLLALSSIGKDSQKKVGEAFVERLLEKGDIHPAVAILLGLDEQNEAIEVYFSQGYYMEAALLTCLTSPADWQRISYLLRKWGEQAVQSGNAELAVRLFSCTSIETTEPWFSPRAQDAAFAAQQERFMQPLTGNPLTGDPMTSPPTSPPSRSGSGRLAAKNAGLKLMTTFEQKAVEAAKSARAAAEEKTPMGVGVTPMDESAMSPRPGEPWLRPNSRNARDPSSARTATPGGYSRRKRLPSKDEIARAKQEAAELVTPQTAARIAAQRPPSASGLRSRRTSSVSSIHEPATALRAATYDAGEFLMARARDDNHLPSPAQGVFTRLREESRNRNASRERKPDGLAVHVMETRFVADNLSPAPSTHDTTDTRNTGYTSTTNQSRGTGALSPPLTGGSLKSMKGKAIDQYISSVDVARKERAESRKREESRRRDRSTRSSSRARDRSDTRGRNDVRYIKPAKRSPSSPVPMSPAEIAEASSRESQPATTDDEQFYKVASPISPQYGRNERRRPSLEPTSAREPRSAGGLLSATEPRSAGGFRSPLSATEPKSAGGFGSLAPLSAGGLGHSRRGSRQRSPDAARLRADSGRGRSQQRGPGSTARSPSSPLPMSPEKQLKGEEDETQSDGKRMRIRARSSSRPEGENLQERRAASRNRTRERSSSRKPEPKEESIGMSVINPSKDSIAEVTEEEASESSVTMRSEGNARPRTLSRKELAARELEERRLSLARRPSAPAIPLPGQIGTGAGVRPPMAQRANTELGNSPTSFLPPMSRAQTVDPDAMQRYGKITGTSTSSAPIGLPATPRAMRHPKYMSTDPNEREGTPPMPDLHDVLKSLSGSDLSQITGSALSTISQSDLSQAPSSLQSSQVPSSLMSNKTLPTDDEDHVGPLLPSSAFGAKQGQAPPRSASAPPDNAVHPAYRANLPHSTRRISIGQKGQAVRKISPPDTSVAQLSPPPIASIGEALAGEGGDTQQVVIIEEQEAPPVLPELQHLAGPPPPPLEPLILPRGTFNEGVINIAIDENDPGSANPGSAHPRSANPDSAIPKSTIETTPPMQFPLPMERAQTSSPNMHRRGRGSIGGTGEAFGSRGFIRGVTDRMRSTSRNRTKSPQDYNAPYETVLPRVPTVPAHHRRESFNRARSPLEQENQIPPPPPPPPGPPLPGYETKISETAIRPATSLPTSRTGSSTGYRNPKEIRANMPPETLQQGVYQAGFL